MTEKIIIIKCSHFFIVRNVSRYIIDIIELFRLKYVIKGFSKGNNSFYKRKVDNSKFFSIKYKHKNEYRFHNNQLPQFIRFLNAGGIKNDSLVIKELPIFTGDYRDIRILDKEPPWILREQQHPFVEFLIDPAERTSFGELRTGTGKTLCALWATSIIKKLTAIIIKPTYIEKWIGDVISITNTSIKEILVILTSKDLINVIQMGLNKKIDQYKFIIISDRVLVGFVDKFINDEDGYTEFKYGCTPSNLYNILGVGVVISDESHQDFFILFRIMLHMHVNKLIALSATLIHKYWETERIYNTVFPKHKRYNKLLVENYIKAYSISYSFRDLRKIETTVRGADMYSHVAFEQSIMKDKVILANYLEFIHFLFQVYYLDIMVPGDKFAIYVSTKALCVIVVDMLKLRHPDMDIRSYLYEDPYENVIDATVRVTTLMSGGTAVDIPNLIGVLNTINVESSQSNVQLIGRIRYIPDKELKFVDIYCNEIEKHRSYHEHRKKLLKAYVKSHTELTHGGRI